MAEPRDGVLVVDKPSGPTSHDVVALVRRLSGTRRVGHGGTLDPFARGVLPLFLGSATRLAEFHLGADKSYRATVCFGARSTTDDLDGDLTPGERSAPSRIEAEDALGRLRGAISQRPPDFSARKVAGRRAYALARAGLTPTLEPRDVIIRRLDLVEWDETDPARPVAVVDVDCTAGTYVRAIARDVGDVLGCGAYLGGLVRTASGSFGLADAHSLDELRAAASGRGAGLNRLIRPPEAGLESLRRIVLEPAEVEAVARGQLIRVRGRIEGVGPRGAEPPTPTPDEPTAAPTTPEPATPAEQGAARPSEPVLVFDARRRLVAVGRLVDGRLAPDKVLVSRQAAPVRERD